jgi:hypothetical protein
MRSGMASLVDDALAVVENHRLDPRLGFVSAANPAKPTIVPASILRAIKIWQNQFGGQYAARKETHATVQLAAQCALTVSVRPAKPYKVRLSPVS